VPGSAFNRFTSARQYAEGLRELKAQIVPSAAGPFVTHLVRIELTLVRLLDADESAARSGFWSIPRGWHYAFFGTRPGCSLSWNGNDVSFGQVLLAGSAERLHLQTMAASHFAAVGIRSATLELYANGLAGETMALTKTASAIDIPAAVLRRLIQLHDRIIRTARARPDAVAQPETARAIEQELIEALAMCLVNGTARRLQPVPCSP
jgi:hypothetical protein